MQQVVLRVSQSVIWAVISHMLLMHKVMCSGSDIRNLVLQSSLLHNSVFVGRKCCGVFRNGQMSVMMIAVNTAQVRELVCKNSQVTI
jgi:hypothetical protein